MSKVLVKGADLAYKRQAKEWMNTAFVQKILTHIKRLHFMDLIVYFC